MMLLGIRKLAFAAVPVVVAGAMLGPMTGSASALPRQNRCGDMITEVYEDWAEAEYYTQDAEQANAIGDWLAWGYYNYMASQLDEAGDDLYNSYLALGCHP